MGTRQDGSTGNDPVSNDRWAEARRRHHLALRGLAEAPPDPWPDAAGKHARAADEKAKQDQPADD